MKTLVIETASAACSVALLAPGEVIDWRHELVGRGHAERLVPMIAELTGGGRADAILVDCGPGSFTGIRVGIAAARGLAIGWGVPVHGFGATALIAAAGFTSISAPALAVVLEGGHGEVFMQVYARPLAATDALVSLSPAAALAALAGRPAVGNGVRHLAALDPALALTDLVADARDARRLPAPFTALAPRPVYGRAPDATPAGPR